MDFLLEWVKEIVLVLVPLSAYLAILLKGWMDARVERKKAKREMQRKAFLNALTLLDAHMSNHLSKEVDKQYIDIALARQYYNELFLTCENPKIIEYFLDLLFEKSSQIDVEKLNQIRNLIRRELGFKNIDNPKNKEVVFLTGGAFIKKDLQNA